MAYTFQTTCSYIAIYYHMNCNKGISILGNELCKYYLFLKLSGKCLLIV